MNEWMNEWRRCPWICPGLLMSHKQSNRQSHRMQNRGKFCLAVFIIPGQCTHTLCVCWALLLNNATQSWSQRAGLSAACQQGLSARGCMPEYKHTLPQARFGCCCCICLLIHCTVYAVHVRVLPHHLVQSGILPLRKRRVCTIGANPNSIAKLYSWCVAALLLAVLWKLLDSLTAVASASPGLLKTQHI